MRKPLVLAVVSMIVIGWLFWWFSPSQVVGRRTHTLIEMMNFENQRGAGVFDIRTLSGLLADDLTVDAPELNIHDRVVGRDQATSAYAWLADHAKVCRFDVTSIDRVEIDGERAVVRATLDGVLEVKQLRLLDGEHRVKLEWSDSGIGWELSRMWWLGDGE